MPVLAAIKLSSEQQLYSVQVASNHRMSSCSGAAFYTNLEEGRWEKYQGQQQKQAEEERFATLSKLFWVCNIFH